jgi:hypothetical protein
MRPIYLYHVLPDQMHGNILYPLHDMRARFPDVFAKEAKKYEGREQLMNKQIPPLDCLWNDVLHCSPFPIEEIVAALHESGFPVACPKYCRFEIDALDPKKLAVFFAKPYKREQECCLFEAFDWSDHQHVSEETKQYYRSCKEKQIAPLWFMGVPHVLYQGALCLDDGEIITRINHDV